MVVQSRPRAAACTSVRAAASAGVLATALLAGCSGGFPADPDGTLDEVTDGVLRVGEAFAVPRDGAPTLDDLRDARERLVALDWKIQDLVVVPVEQLPAELLPGSSPTSPHGERS